MPDLMRLSIKTELMWLHKYNRGVQQMIKKSNFYIAEYT